MDGINSMKAALISLGSKSSEMTAEAMKQYFDHVDHIDLRTIEVNLTPKGPVILVKDTPIEKYDCVYAKGSAHYASLLCSVTTGLYKTAYLPITPQAFIVGKNKLLTQLWLLEKGIPMPKTYVSSSAKAAKNVFNKLHYPVIIKLPEGTQGKGVMFADSYAAASSLLDALGSLKQPFIIQEYVETEGTDIRAFVIGDMVVAAMKRYAAVEEKRANIHAGATGEAYNPSPAEASLACAAARTLGADICAVDIIQSAKGPLVLEVNLSPGIRGITEYTQVNVADCIAKFLAKKSREQHTKKVKEVTQLLEEGNAEIKEIIAQVDYRGQRILLPEIVSQWSKLHEHDEVVIRSEKGKLSIEKQ